MFTNCLLGIHILLCPVTQYFGNLGLSYAIQTA